MPQYHVFEISGASASLRLDKVRDFIMTDFGCKKPFVENMLLTHI